MRRTHQARTQHLSTHAAWICAASCAAVVALTPSIASAQNARVVIAEFKGPAKPTKDVRLAVIRAIKDRYELIPVKDLDRARSGLGERGNEPQALAKLAAEINADGIVVGEVEKKGRGYSIRIAVHTGQDGEVVDTAAHTLSSRRVGSRDRKAISEGTLAVMNAFDTRREELAAAASQPEPEPEPSLVSDPDVIGDGDDGDLPDEPDTGGDKPAIVTGTAYAGTAFIARRLAFAVGDNIGVAMQPNEYEGPPSFGFRIAGEVYPFGKFVPAARDVGFDLLFERSLFLKSAFNGEDFGTAQTRFGIGAHYNYSLDGVIDPIGSSRTSPSVRGGLGFQHASFAIDSGMTDIGLPNVAYNAFSVGAGARVPVMAKLAAYTDLSLMIGLSSGDITAAENYGDGSFTGLEWDIGAAYDVIELIHVQAGFRLTRFGLSFDGNGTLSEIDGDGQADVSGASDLFLGFYLAAGYRF